jgi:hypothetical protein
MEIEILDPGVDPLGNPAVLPIHQPGAETVVEIPPTVLVHKYYYTGDRKFQGPLLSGGSAIIVANHPKTGERCYIEAQMLPGAPKVIYTSRAIEYDYGKQGITLSFGCFGSPRIIYRNCRPAGRVIGEAVAGMARGTHHVLDRSGVGDFACHVKDGAKNLGTAAVAGVKTAGTVIVTPVVQAAQFVPGARMLTPCPADRAAAARDRAVQRSAKLNSRLDETIRTVR